MVFELGKFYKHSGAVEMMHMIAVVDKPIMWFGPTLIAEHPSGELRPVGMDETSAQNYKEITRDEYMVGIK
jgi:hypothetical protein